MTNSLVLAGARTPIGKLLGSLATLTAVELGGIAIREALGRAGVSAEKVDAVLIGQVLQAGQGQNPARQAAVLAGLPMTVPATTVNKVCLSGIHAIHLADLMIRADEADIVVAGGMESMTGAPHLVAGARAGLRYGGGRFTDVIDVDGLSCAFESVSMGEATDRFAHHEGIGRLEQDEVAIRSHERAALATKEGRFAEEIVRVVVPRRRGDSVTIDADEGIRSETNLDALARLRPAFVEGGSVTAGNASQISDGAAVVVIASAEAAKRLSINPLAELVGYGQVAGPDTSLIHQPAGAILQALEHSTLGLADVDLFEINEAFAAVVVGSSRQLGLPDDVVNVNGGAIALGHPIGASGARLVISLATELHHRAGGIGAAAVCGGGGQGEAVLLRSRD